jgi:hypothetical protein
MPLTKEFLRYVAEFERNPQYREMAKELLAFMDIKELEENIAKKEKEEEFDTSLCDDCDMTYPCCNKCIGV